MVSLIKLLSHSYFKHFISSFKVFEALNWKPNPSQIFVFCFQLLPLSVNIRTENLVCHELYPCHYCCQSHHEYQECSWHDFIIVTIITTDNENETQKERFRMLKIIVCALSFVILYLTELTF